MESHGFIRLELDRWRVLLKTNYPIHIGKDKTHSGIYGWHYLTGMSLLLNW